ncbi:MAG TPA: TIGR03086 family protein [Acidimicrobiaceae bacterium]|nr:TIGR03086 family protein [Acidimicrobiaceae bacterium]
MSTERLSRAFASTRAVLANIERGQLDQQTPCQLWTVHQLINHVVGAPRFAVHILETGARVDDDEDYAAGDYMGAYEKVSSEALAAFEAPGVMDKMVPMPFGEIPGSFLVTIMTTDQLTHGWDLARATGQSTDLEPELAEELLAQAAVPDEFRGEEGKAPFGPRQEAPHGATSADQLAAYLGRRL